MDNSEPTYELDINLLEPNPLQPRGLITPESLSELADSIKEHGVLEPLVVAKTPAGYQIIAGERRWRAAKIAGLASVPVIIRETSPQGMLEMAIVENVQRQDLNPLERAQAYRRLMEEFGLPNGDIAQRVAKSAAYISNTLRLLSLPDALKDALMSEQTTEGHVRALMGLEDPHLMIEGYKEVMRKSLSVRGTEDLVRRMKAKFGIISTNKAHHDRALFVNDEIDQIQAGLTEKLSATGTKAAVKYVLSASQARLEIKLPGDPEITNDMIKRIYQAISSFFTPQEI
ncbi:ParB/RepB/Spo0J family partition protein [Patescibacteria group bacterium]|nr:ParB/RepB/Spo0J family partition protein [Patescibacteria group bacterium]MCL5410114.1 ParB/RepB/Spo0J family partition protein [Patescibacteria group bacterium]